MMRAINARLERVRSGDAGITMVEVLVVTMLSILVLTMSIAFFAQVAKATTLANDRRNNTAQAANASNAITQLVRAAKQLDPPLVTTTQKPFIAANSESLEFYSNTSLSAASPQPIRVKIAISSARKLTLTRWATWSTASASTTNNYDGYLVPTPNASKGQSYLFTYYDADGVQIGTPGTALTAAQLDQIAQVRISVTLKAASSSLVDAVTIQSTVGLPNLGLATTS